MNFISSFAFTLAGLAAGLATAVHAAEPPTPRSPHKWTLSTDDTALAIEADQHTIRITALRSRTARWNWIKTPASVPLPALEIEGKRKDLNWDFQGAEQDRTHGVKITLRYTCQDPALTLVSTWEARPGPGPVENRVSIVNGSGKAVTFSAADAAALAMTSDYPVTLHRADKTNVGEGKVHEDLLAPSAHIRTGSGEIPLALLQAGPRHGVYFGFEWELGGFDVATQQDPKQIGVRVQPITETVVRSSGETFEVPAVYYGAYTGDLDDGANRFKRWFWNYKITRSLHDNFGEPWVEVCMQEIGGTGATSITGATPQSVYDRLASTGAECVKMDFWDGSGKCWYTDRDWMYHPENWLNGFDFAKKAHAAGLKASLYMGGTYKDGDLTTTADRDAELNAVQYRYDQGWFDIWRTDLYTAPKEPIPQTYQGVTNFLHIQDALIGSRPGYRYENCCNGGKYKGFAICRRMTFCTMNDVDSTAWKTRTTYYSNTFGINPVQLKSDLGPAETAYDLRTDMLGSILTWAADNPVYRQHIALYKSRQRPILRGCNVYHILPMADGANWDGMEFYNSDIDQGSVFLFKPSSHATDGDTKTIKLKGLTPRAKYKLTFQDRTSLNCVKSGLELMQNGITVSGMTGENASEIIWISGPRGRIGNGVMR